jgi:3-mercaptopyruvate sulfurtransferase SseA
MDRLRYTPFIFALTLLALTVIGCSASSEEPSAGLAATAAPAATPEPTAAPEFERPRASSEVPRMAVDELKERLDEGQDVVIVDTRSQANFDTGRIAGAIRMPSSTIDSPLEDFALDHLIVLYCA